MTGAAGPSSELRDADVARAYEVQGRFCHGLGAPLLGGLMERAARDAAVGGPFARVADGWTGDPLRGLFPLRVFAAVHRRVLDGALPALAALFPTTGGTPDVECAFPLARGFLSEAAAEVAPELASFPQTNEVARSGALLPGLLAVARRAGGPLHLAELGASAGLNLLVDRFRHEIGGRVLGAPDSPVRIALAWSGPDAPLEGTLEVASRAGCDLEPLDVRESSAPTWMGSFVWPDHPERLARMRAAIALARESGVTPERARAGPWLEARLAAPRPPGATVVYHSSFWMYVPDAERAQIRRALEEAGAAADATRPLAWLRLELAADGRDELRLRQWPGPSPGGEERLLLRTMAHPRRLDWADELVPSGA